MHRPQIEHYRNTDCHYYIVKLFTLRDIKLLPLTINKFQKQKSACIYIVRKIYSSWISLVSVILSSTCVDVIKLPKEINFASLISSQPCSSLIWWKFCHNLGRKLLAWNRFKLHTPHNTHKVTYYWRSKVVHLLWFIVIVIVCHIYLWLFVDLVQDSLADNRWERPDF